MDQHNPADVVFAQAMTPHHGEAVRMSRTLLSKSDIEPGVADFARRTIESQEPQMEQLTRQLADWGHEPLPPATTGTLEQTALEGAEGAAAALLFLQLMAQHHKSALLVAHAESINGDSGALVGMARKVIADQSAELETMAELAKQIG